MHAHQADNAVLLEPLIDTLVILLQDNVQTASAVVAVEVGALADATNAASIAMVDTFFLVLIIVERADLAIVLREVFVAPDASFGLHLLRLAAEALDVRDLVPVQLMVFLRVHLILKQKLVMT